MEKFYRGILVILLLLQVLWFFTPWGSFYINDSNAALYWLGMNSLIDTHSIIIISNIVTVLYLVAYLGLIFFKKWARTTFIVVSIAGGISISLYGISVQSNYEAMLSYFMSLGDGFIIAISYFTNIDTRFSGKK